MFGCNKISEVFIIDDYFDKVFYSLKLRPLFFEHFDNRQKFFTVNLIVIFGRNIFSRKEDNKMKNFCRIILKEYIS